MAEPGVGASTDDVPCESELYAPCKTGGTSSNPAEDAFEDIRSLPVRRRGGVCTMAAMSHGGEAGVRRFSAASAAVGRPATR